VVARAALHFWEEPPISGSRGSGTVFFAHCPLRCVYCQNAVIAAGEAGAEVSVERLGEMCLELQEQGALNVNFVTPTHYAPEARAAVAWARERGLALPVVWNTSGYETGAAEGVLDYGNEVGYPVGSQLAGVVVAHLHARLHAGSHHEGASAGKRARRGHPCIREPRHHRRDDGIVADRTTAVALQHVEQPRHPHARLVGRHALRRGHLPGGFQLAADEEAQVRIRVPHVHA